MRRIDAKTDLLQPIADAVAQAKDPGVKSAPELKIKALKAKARLAVFKGKHRTK